MIRFILLLAVAFGIYWCCNNIDFSNLGASVSSGVKSEKTIKAVNERRTQMAEDNENAMNN